MEILYSSGELHDAIKKVLADPKPHDRRVVLVAFVGGNAQAFLPDPKGLKIACWLQPGSSDALTIDALRKRGAKIYKSERLHMKVYWSSSGGCVICSANASGGALGSGNQKEAGVWLPPGKVNIERLWTYAKPKLIKDHDLKRLTRETERRAFGPNNNLSGERRPDFLEWQSFSGRRDWKLGSWQLENEFAKNAVQKAKQSYGVSEPNHSVNVRQDQVRKHDWLLKFRLPNGTDLNWMHVDFIIIVSPSDKAAFVKGYPFQAVQPNEPRKYPPPPFKLDPAFRSAFKIAIKDFGAEQIESIESLHPPKKLLNLIAKNMRTVT